MEMKTNIEMQTRVDDDGTMLGELLLLYTPDSGVPKTECRNALRRVLAAAYVVDDNQQSCSNADRGSDVLLLLGSMPFRNPR